MPIYEYECPEHGIFERVIIVGTIAENTKTALCRNNEDCIRLCPKVPSMFSTNQVAKPTRYFENPKTGQKQLAMSSTQKPPRGYIEKELKGSIQRSKFEKEEQQKRNIEYELDVARLQQAKDNTRISRQDDTEANLTKIADKADNPSAVKSLMREAMNRSKQKKLPPKRKNVMFQVNHTDKSNID